MLLFENATISIRTDPSTQPKSKITNLVKNRNKSPDWKANKTNAKLCACMSELYWKIESNHIEVRRRNSERITQNHFAAWILVEDITFLRIAEKRHDISGGKPSTSKLDAQGQPWGNNDKSAHSLEIITRTQMVNSTYFISLQIEKMHETRRGIFISKQSNEWWIQVNASKRIPGADVRIGFR